MNKKQKEAALMIADIVDEHIDDMFGEYLQDVEESIEGLGEDDLDDALDTFSNLFSKHMTMLRKEIEGAK